MGGKKGEILSLTSHFVVFVVPTPSVSKRREEVVR